MAPVKPIDDCEALLNDSSIKWADTSQLNVNGMHISEGRENSSSYTYTMTNHTGQTIKQEENPI